MVKVTLEEADGNFERMLKKFIKRVKKARIIEEVQDRRYYTKPSVKRRRKEIMRERMLEKLKNQQETEEKA